MPSREGCRVFVGNLPGQVRERDIDRFFEKYGRVRNIFVKNGRYGFCEFDDYRDADDAVHDLNGRELLGVRVTVEHARGPRRDRFGDRQRRPWVDRYGAPKRTDYRLIVENLSSKVSWQDLKDLMRRAGDVSYANAHNNRRNEGVVEFVSRGDMERAFDKYDDYEFHGKRIKLVKDRCRSASRSRDSRSKSRSRSTSRSARYRSKSRSRSRSRSRSGSRSRSVEKARERSKSASGSRSRSVSKSSNRSSSPRKEKVEDDVQMEDKEREEEEEEEETVEKASKSPKEENEEEAENDIEKGRTLKQEKEPEELEAKEESKG